MRRLDVLVLVVVVAHAVWAPHCKVEESFALQATHDALHHGANIGAYDHREFPGVVPRTSLASFALALASVVPVGVVSAFTRATTKTFEQVICRVVLGAYVAMSHARFRDDVRSVFGDVVSAFTAIASLCQFHFWFYASRPLMNVFALGMTLLGCGAWIRATHARRQRDMDEAVVWVTVSTFLLRCDVALLLAPMGLHALASGLISPLRACVLGGCAAAATVAVSTAVDSWFWNALVWPEGAVLYFNTALNKSSEWGTSPWHWYASSALPKSLLCAYPLALTSVFIERRARPLMFAAVFYVGLYSFLPHKELRFIFPTLPLFNCCAATVLARLWNNRRKRPFIAFCALVALVASAVLVAVFTAASSVNYPGGEAFRRLHAEETPGRAHVDVPAAMTGVSRFGEARDADSGWSYSKIEGLGVEDFAKHGFEYLLNAHERVPGYDVAFVVDGYAGLRLDLKSAPAVLRVKTKPVIYVHRRIV